MLVTTLNYQNQKIEFYNTWLGKETIIVDGLIVSSKRSLLGAEHCFSIHHNGIVKQCSFNTSFGYGGIVYDFYVDGTPILESSKNELVILTMMYGIPVGAAVGVLMYFFK